MTTRRTARVNRAIQEAVSTAVLFKVKDPRVKNVTVLRAEASDDLRQAKVYVSVMGDEKRQALTMNGLAAARGFLQSKVADRLQTKQTPILTFVLDQIVKQNAAAQAALSHLFPVADASDADDEELEGMDVDFEALDPEGALEVGSEAGHDSDDDSDDTDADEFGDDEFEDFEAEFETVDLNASNGTGATGVTTQESILNLPAAGSVSAGQAVPGPEVRADVNKLDESKPAELEENEDLQSR
jgi:ribosome-binding factor A